MTCPISGKDILVWDHLWNYCATSFGKDWTVHRPSNFRKFQKAPSLVLNHDERCRQEVLAREEGFEPPLGCLVPNDFLQLARRNSCKNFHASSARSLVRTFSRSIRHRLGRLDHLLLRQLRGTDRQTELLAKKDHDTRALLGANELSVRFGAKRRETVPVSIKRKLARTRPPSLGSRVQGVEE
jgi:hypothetical protein